MRTEAYALFAVTLAALLFVFWWLARVLRERRRRAALRDAWRAPRDWRNEWKP